VSIDPGEPGPPVLDLRRRRLSFSSVPRLVGGVVVALVCFGAVGWLVIGSVFGAPFRVAAPMSVLFGIAFVAWEVRQSWRGTAVAVGCALGGVAVLFAHWATS
jgi:hypothetical protein